MKSALVAIFALLLSASGATIAQDRPSQPPQCGITTARTNSDLLKAQRFFKQLKAAVEKNDPAAVAGMVRFPLHVNGKAGVNDRQAFLREYDHIFNQKVRSAIQRQRVECIFGNWQGFMAGNGNVWFDYSERDPRFAIIAVNNSAQHNRY